MKKTKCALYPIMMVFAISSMQAIASNVPNFKPEKLVISMPAEWRDLMEDSAAVEKDRLIYRLNGQQFKGNDGAIPLKSKGFTGVAQPQTPTELIAQYVYLLQSGDLNSYKVCFDPNLDKNSQKEISDSFQELSTTFQKIESVKINLIFELKNGFYIFYQTDRTGLMNAFVTKIKGRYYFAHLSDVAEDDEAKINNLLRFTFHTPDPYLKPAFGSKIDTLLLSSQVKINFKLNRKGNYLIVFEPHQGASVISSIRDQSAADSNPGQQQVTLTLTPSSYFNHGDVILYAIESNFPVSYVTETMIKEGVSQKVYVRK
jgi:hypothetical protein